jgi:hypothetical protein
VTHTDKTHLAQILSDGGIAGKHAPLSDTALQVGPTTANHFNAVRSALIPIACWRLENVRFEFDSSFLGRDTKAELSLLANLLKDHPPPSKSGGKPGCPLSIFGHCDPVGDDDYNKQLSGRRAMSVYAVLTRNVTLWEKLFSGPLGNDNWGRPSLEIMLNTISPAASPEKNRDEATQHQRDAGKRKLLFERYMDALCGPNLKLQKEDFLGHGDDSGGKADFQGCSEFNPVLIFSEEKARSFERDQNHAARNDANALNRRVVALIFRAGSQVDPTKWPCPRATEGAAECKARFWSDGEQRRSRRLPDEPRRFDEAEDTFACRFYQRLVSKSPCEAVVPIFQIRVFDHNARPLPFAPCVVTPAGGEPRALRASGRRRVETSGAEADDRDLADSDAFITLRGINTPVTVNVKWNRPQAGDGPDSPLPSLNDSFEFELDVAIEIPEDEPEKAALVRLTNMGYVRGPQRVDDIREFQRDYKERFSDIEIDGTLNAATQKAIKKAHDACDLVLKGLS